MNAKAVLTSGLLSIYCNYAIVWTTIVENLLHKNFGDTYNTKLLLRHVMSRKPCKQKIRSGCYKKAWPQHISKRLGHSKVSTTTDIYSHIIKQADEQAAECIADVVLRKHKNA